MSSLGQLLVIDLLRNTFPLTVAEKMIDGQNVKEMGEREREKERKYENEEGRHDGTKR